MAVKTRAQIAAEIAALFADNTTGDISASDLRTVCNDLNDSASYEGSKVYKALLTQTGTNAPVATVLENTLSGTPVWSYSAVGKYIMTLAGEFIDADKIAISCGLGNYLTSSYPTIDIAYTTFSGYRQNDDEIHLFSINTLTDAGYNGLLYKTLITIEVYPV